MGSTQEKHHLYIRTNSNLFAKFSTPSQLFSYIKSSGAGENPQLIALSSRVNSQSFISVCLDRNPK